MTDGATPPVVLTVAGTDSGGAAGIAADLTTFSDLGAHGASVVTAVTAQDTTSVRDIHRLPVAMVAAQIDAVLADLPVAAVKTGMLGSAEAVALVADRFSDQGLPVVVDPVLVATSGAVLGDDQLVRAYRRWLLPVATVVTPNLDEARVLTEVDGPPDVLARLLAETGPAVVLTGGVGSGSCTDWVALPGEDPVPLTHHAVVTGNDHGTGCTFSAALTVHLARRVPLISAVTRAATYTTAKLRLSQHWELGRGRGPIAHTRGEIA
ncbi:bifunctional hydroxymethylpyrimidine kinase/phosphomethylpyrimidine kinase [Nocardioides pocheonensis]|uniref:Bifunctional hydroxymethylpyrimidine kinase/phosphomethylpyrimidine kinase n=1 Tax=Nocardioides pocheonensis TaxID=661485 RepID=A0A3N0GJC3_9ACTN|nr:bifunctional hydroxymethylpyrimidine kinase/phosphomethylpyrimidine kinase [Nocardioides pocheonensis]RNM12150.1 bifunctional hydroxymethylpyrimidine kinase/phosphomethylpyrimidine kinase [Nocardioides pocheonensis]